MVVVNIVGFPYKIEKNGKELIVPADGQPHEIPDEFGEDHFDNVFKILVRPRPKIIEIPKVEEIKPNIIEIDISKIEEEKLPLEGIKIKKKTREKLIKRGTPHSTGNVKKVALPIEKETVTIEEVKSDGNI